jgi:hypothetical protein
MFAAGPMLLAGCSSERWAPKDFCAKQGRQISKQERIIFVLQEIAKREDKFGNLHFMHWRKNYKLSHRGITEKETIDTYYKTFPSCCDVLRPAYLSRELLADNDWDNGVEEQLKRYPGFWVVDVQLFWKAPPRNSKRQSIAFSRIGVSDCNDKISLEGFWL